MQSIAKDADFKELHAMLRRTRGDRAWDLESLRASWARFVHSKDAFHRRQAHPIRYWATRINQFGSPTPQETDLAVGMHRAQAEKMTKKNFSELFLSSGGQSRHLEKAWTDYVGSR